MLFDETRIEKTPERKDRVVTPQAFVNNSKVKPTVSQKVSHSFDSGFKKAENSVPGSHHVPVDGI